MLNIAVVVESSGLGVLKTKDWPINLNLGRLSSNSEDAFKDPRFSEMQSSSSSGSTKRTRAPVMGIQSVACLVDGCTADLSKCRDYHRRHKVCEPHSKTRMVTIGGYERRFCQQCSRFHSLVEFDEGKRSCRKRLDGHNRRRRKPQPETFSISSGSFLSAHQVAGTKYLNFGGPQMFPTSSTRNSDWGDPAKANDHSVLYNSHSSTGLYTHSYRGGNQQFPFLQAELSYSEASSVVQPLLEPKCASGNGRAHSLLSSSSLAETGETGLSSCIHQPQQQPFMADLNYQQQRSVLASDTNLSCQDMFQIGPNGPSSVGPHHRLSFSWD